MHCLKAVLLLRLCARVGIGAERLTAEAGASGGAGAPGAAGALHPRPIGIHGRPTREDVQHLRWLGISQQR